MEGFEMIMRDFETFTFAFVRSFAVVALLPFLGGRSVPFMVKVGMATLLAIMVTPLIHNSLPPLDRLFVIGIFREVLIGITIGFVVRLIFAGVEMAGQVTGIQMGFGVATVIDPQTNSQLSVFAQLFNIVAALLFFSLNMYLALIMALKESFDIVPPYGFTLSPSLLDGFLILTGSIFTLALKIAAPIMVVILLINIALGIVARTVPQMNVFIIGFPITIAGGLVVFLLALPFFTGLVGNLYHLLPYWLIDLLNGGSGG